MFSYLLDPGLGKRIYSEFGYREIFFFFFFLFTKFRGSSWVLYFYYYIFGVSPKCAHFFQQEVSSLAFLLQFFQQEVSFNKTVTLKPELMYYRNSGTPNSELPLIFFFPTSGTRRGFKPELFFKSYGLFYFY